MSADLIVIGAEQVLVLAAEGGPVRGDRDAVDLIAEGLSLGATWIAAPAERLGDDFFVLSTRIAGEVIQKFVNYRIKLAIVGDITRHSDASPALRDFIRESNRGAHVWFVDSLDDLAARLGRAGA